MDKLKKKKMKYSFLISLVIMISCNHSNHSNEDITVPIDLTAVTEMSMSEIFSQISYIPLETLPESIIDDQPLTIKVYNDKIYTIDKNRVLRFNIDGSFDKEIIHNGRGPEESVSIMDIAVNDEIIYILGRTRLFKLDSNGNQLMTAVIPTSSLSIECFMDDKILIYHGLTFSEDKFYKASIYNSNLDLIERFWETPEVSFRPVRRNSIHIGSDVTLVTQTYNDTIFDFSNGTPIPKLILEFGDQSTTTKTEYTTQKSIFISDIYPTSQFWLIRLNSFMNQMREQYNIFYYPDNETIRLTSNKLCNDIDGGIGFSPFRCYNNNKDEAIYMVLKPVKIKERLNKLKEEGQDVDSNETFIDMAEKISINDNPVLMKCEIKK
jgi:hypothetical protein